MPYVPKSRPVTAQRSLEARMQADKEWWHELAKLANANDLAGFYTCYAAYLEGNNVISERRELLVRMAKAVVEQHDRVAVLLQERLIDTGP